MSYLLVILLLFLSIVTSSKVLDLSNSNFQSELDKYSSLFVMFSSPDCSVWKEMLKELEIAAELVNELTPPSYIAVVDGTNQKEVVNEYGIDAYPSIVYFKNKEAMAFTGEFEGKQIYEWIKGNWEEEVKESEEELLDMLEKGIKEMKEKNDIGRVEEREFLGTFGVFEKV